MYSEDFILRMINQAMAVLVKVLGFKQAGQRQEALQAVDQALELLLGLRASLFRQLDEPRMLQMLVLQGRLDVERLAVLADITYEEGDILEQEGRVPESILASRRALRFYLESALTIYALNFSQLPVSVMVKIENLRRRLGREPLPLETRMALVDYYERLLSLHPNQLAAAGMSHYGVEQTALSLQQELGFDSRSMGA
jgi:tetratricopeptide (TPR) repeat protein